MVPHAYLLQVKTCASLPFPLQDAGGIVALQLWEGRASSWEGAACKKQEDVTCKWGPASAAVHRPLNLGERALQALKSTATCLNISLQLADLHLKAGHHRLQVGVLCLQGAAFGNHLLCALLRCVCCVYHLSERGADGLLTKRTGVPYGL